MTPRKKILVVISSLRRGGAERVVSRLTQAWAQEHRVTVVVFNAEGRAYLHGGTLVDLDVPSRGGLLRKMLAATRRIFQLRRLMARVEPDFVFGFMESANLSLVVASSFTPWRRRLTVSVHNDPSRMHSLHRLGAFLLYRCAARVVAVSQGVGERLSRKILLAPSRITVIYNPVALKEVESVTAFLSPPVPGPYFFAAGRLAPQKDFARMLRLFAMLPPDGTRLIIAGDGPERASLHALAATAGLSGRVVFLGNVENPFVYMQHAIAFLMTSRYEGFPMALIEALACGCPVLAMDCDFGPREAVRDGQDGFIVSPQDESAFVSKLSLLASDRTLRDKLGASAVRRARDFDTTSIASQWLSV